MDFTPSHSGSIGLEIEFQLVDPASCDLTDGILELLAVCDDRHIQAEFAQSMVEVASAPCDSIRELDDDVRTHFAHLTERVHRLGLRLCAAGTHPFFAGFAHVTPEPRFNQMKERAGYVAHYDVTFATHVHIGVESRRELVGLQRDFRAFLPVLVALSANSPFWRGHRTGYASFRHVALSMGRSYGVPPSFDSWHALSDFYSRARKAGMCKDARDFHWDVRPRPDLGTVEVRTMDAFSSLSESVSFAAFVQALADYCRHTPSSRRTDLPRPLPWWFARENFFEASRVGLDAAYVDPDGETVELSEITDRLLPRLRPHAQARGTTSQLERVERLMDYPGYQRQLDIFAQTGSLETVTRRLTERIAQ